jgi:hypothetical protein
MVQGQPLRKLQGRDLGWPLDEGYMRRLTVTGQDDGLDVMNQNPATEATS